MSAEFSPPVTIWHNERDDEAPLVVLLHGRGSDERDIAALAELLPDQATYVAVRGPIAEGPGFAWFFNHGIGQPLAESLATVMDWFREWLEGVAPRARPVILVGFSAGAAFAGALALADPTRYLGVAMMSGTLPFDAGVPTTPRRLEGRSVFLSQGDSDTVIPKDLQVRTRDFLENESAATLSVSTDPGGHTIGQVALERLRRWIANLLAETTARAR
jgi:phospholipase/carboxylesterase